MFFPHAILNCDEGPRVMNRIIRSALSAGLLFLLPLPTWGQMTIKPWTLNNGGTIASDRSYRITGSVGQSFVGIASEAALTIKEGFWQKPERTPNSVTFFVTIPPGTPPLDTICIAANVNNWFPGTGRTGLPMTKIDALNWTLSIVCTSETAIEYKYTRGNWETVEKYADGTERPNRTFTTTSAADTLRDVIENWATFTDVNREDEALPRAYGLSQNYPNPFNPETVIRYQVPGVSGQASVVSVTIYDLLGREVAVLVNEEKMPGTYSVTWNARLRSSNSGGQASGMASGIYFYQLKADGNVFTKKMILLS
jgi:hypothetical protein